MGKFSAIVLRSFSVDQFALHEILLYSVNRSGFQTEWLDGSGDTV